jgi:hypothetical protein
MGISFPPCTEEGPAKAVPTHRARNRTVNLIFIAESPFIWKDRRCSDTLLCPHTEEICLKQRRVHEIKRSVNLKRFGLLQRV